MDLRVWDEQAVFQFSTQEKTFCDIKLQLLFECLSFSQVCEVLLALLCLFSKTPARAMPKETLSESSPESEEEEERRPENNTELHSEYWRMQKLCKYLLVCAHCLFHSLIDSQQNYTTLGWFIGNICEHFLFTFY